MSEVQFNHASLKRDILFTDWSTIRSYEQIIKSPTGVDIDFVREQFFYYTNKSM